MNKLKYILFFLFHLFIILFGLAYCTYSNAATGKVSHSEEVYIPVNAYKYMPLVLVTIKNTWPELPEYSYLPALIEQESCYTLTSKNCFAPTAELKTSREEGGGFLQVTRAYSSNGGIRFDALNDNLKLDPRLKTLNWSNLYSRPDDQLIIGLRMVQSSYNKIHLYVNDIDVVLDMTDSAYNAGLGGLLNKRLKCSMTPNCDKDIWFGNVENICLTGNKALYGKNTACMINTTHVRNVRKVKRAKYDKLLKQMSKTK